MASAVQRVVAPPYDALQPHERYAYAQAHPDNFLSVILSPDDLPVPPLDPRAVGRAAREQLELLVREYYGGHEDAAFYIYDMAGNGHQQRGVVGALQASDAGLVLGHEHVIQHRVDSLAAFYDGTGINASPVAMMFRSHPPARAAMARIAQGRPDVEFHAPEGFIHRIWKVRERGFGEAIGGIDRWYITDGHHRIAAAMAGAPHAQVLVVAFPAAEMKILGYHRVVNAEIPDDFFDRIANTWRYTEVAGAPTTASGVVGARIDGKWYRLERVRPRPGDPVDGLDVALLHSEIISDGLGVRDVSLIRYLVGSDPAQTLERETGNGAGFLLEPLDVEQVMAVADAGRALPAKSTWFTPKVRSGLFVVER